MKCNTENGIKHPKRHQNSCVPFKLGGKQPTTFQSIPLKFSNPYAQAITGENFPGQTTSAQSERAFNQAGLICTARRAQMSAKKLSDVECLNSVVKMGFLNSHDAYT